ncbi:hypothetical protein [Methanobrevibacter cuticularis]|nr:hypothetical protein [Methanobrevibacter cuticularis]
MDHAELTYEICYENKKVVEMHIIETKSNKPNLIYFKEYRNLFENDEWQTIKLIEGELIPLVNQLDEVDRKTPINNYETFRENLNKIWETYKLEKEALKLDKGEIKDMGDQITITRVN